MTTRRPLPQKWAHPDPEVDEHRHLPQVDPAVSAQYTHRRDPDHHYRATLRVPLEERFHFSPPVRTTVARPRLAPEDATTVLAVTMPTPALGAHEAHQMPALHSNYPSGLHFASTGAWRLAGPPSGTAIKIEQLSMGPVSDTRKDSLHPAQGPGHTFPSHSLMTHFRRKNVHAVAGAPPLSSSRGKPHWARHSNSSTTTTVMPSDGPTTSHRRRDCNETKFLDAMLKRGQTMKGLIDPSAENL